MISVEDGEGLSLEQIRALVDASEEVRFHSQDRGELYEWVNRTLRQQDYSRLKRGVKPLLRRYIAKMTGLSRARAARLWAALLREALHAGRHRSAGGGGRSARNVEWPSQVEDSPAGLA